MRPLVRKITGIGCAILLLPCFAGGCRKRPAESTPNAAQVSEQQIRNALDDLFAYIKIARTDKIYSYCEDSSAAEEYIQSVIECAGNKALETACSRVRMTVGKVIVREASATVEMKVTCCDDTAVLKEALEINGFADESKVADAISSAPLTEKDLSLKVRRSGDGWKLDTKSTDALFEALFGFLKTSNLIAVPEETIPQTNKVDISVYDAYWVDTRGEETGGYHCSDGTICLYVYTWNTYNNVEIYYQYEDRTGEVLYTNSFLMKSSTDWIACSWCPTKPVPEGEITCRLYEPSGENFYVSRIGIYSDDVPLPFPVTWFLTSGWRSEYGEEIEIYPADVTHLIYHAQALKFYKDLDLVYRFLDEEGQVLFEGEMSITEYTDTFEFTWEPEEFFEGGEKITLEVTTKEGNPFLKEEVMIDLPELPEESDVAPSDGSSQTSETKAGSVKGGIKKN